MHRLIARVAVAAVALGMLAGCSGGKKAQHEVWVIGLDGGDWDILGPVIDAGGMPNLKKLRDEGAWGRLGASSRCCRRCCGRASPPGGRPIGTA